MQQSKQFILKPAWMCLAMLSTLISLSLHGGNGSSYSIRVNPSAVTDAIEAKAKKEGTLEKINTMLRALDGQLIHQLDKSKKFALVSKSQLATIEEEQLYAQQLVSEDAAGRAEVGKMAANRYVFIVEVSRLKDLIETKRMAQFEIEVVNRTVNVSATAQVYDTTSGSLLVSSSASLEKKSQRKVKLSQVNGEPEYVTDLTEVAEELAQELTRKAVNSLFPAKVLKVSSDGKTVTFNRGAGSGIQKNQLWTVYGVDEPLIDPDTGVNLGAEEYEIGQVRVSRVTPNYSQARVTKGGGFDTGQILRISE